MAHFYFDLHECGDINVDEEGQELGDLVEARGQAILCARDIMVSQLQAGRRCLGCAIVIRDEIGATAMTVPFNDAVAIALAKNC